MLIVADRGGLVYTLDPQTGARKGVLDLKSGVNADLLVLSNGQVLIATTGGDMIRIDPKRLEIVSRVKLT